jgi:glycine betaine/proline transport system permease protein
MLFRVGDFTAMIAVILYAIAPAIRYTRHGVAETRAELVEAGTALGCTRLQSLARIRLPLALPEMLLGLNQTIMLALSMLVITAPSSAPATSARVYIASPRPISAVASWPAPSVAAIAIIADRLIQAASESAPATRLGLYRMAQGTPLAIDRRPLRSGGGRSSPSPEGG